MHPANPETSERLQRVIEALTRAGTRGLTSMELTQAAHVVAPATCISELRYHGYPVRCQREGRSRWRYWMDSDQMRMRL